MSEAASRISIRLPASTLARLRRLAKRDGVTVSDVVRAALSITDAQKPKKKKSRRATLA